MAEAKDPGTASPRSEFDEINTALKGTTVLKTPRVSRETIISVLQSHTNLIQSMKKDHAKLAFKVTEIDTANKENNKKMDRIVVDMDAQKKSIADLFRVSNEFRLEMDELSEKVAELYLLKKHINEQQDVLENLSARYNKFSTEVNEFMGGVGETIEMVEKNSRDTQFQLKELKDYVDHFADNLVLSSGQITVEVDAGFSSKAVSLTETLQMAKGGLSNIETDLNHKQSKIEQMCADIDSKAPDTVLFNVNTLERKVATIEMHIRKEEEQGIGAIRKTCEELNATVQSLTMEMSEKIDRESVGFIVHEKYEEIVRYLQDALQSSLEDENRFKQKADEIQEMVILLTNSKADRTEIQHMQELMVKSEALLKKVGGQMNIKERLKDFINRKELDSYLEMKVDKIEFEQQLQMVMASTKRNRKLSSMAGGTPPVVEDAVDSLTRGAAMRRPVVNSAGQRNMMTQQQSQFVSSVPGSIVGADLAPQLLTPQMMQRLQPFAGPPGTYGGVAGPGGVGFVADSFMPPTGPGPTTYGGDVPVIAIGQRLGEPNNNNNNNNSSSPGRGNSAESGVSDAAVFLGSGGKQQQGKNNILGSSSDFGAFARGKGGGKHPVTSNSLPTTVVPGTFRLATEAGRPGSPSSSHNNNNDDMNNDNDPFAASAATSALGSAPPPSIPVMVPKLDASGEPIIDPATGQPVLQQQVDADGSPVFQDPSGGLINAQGYQVVQQPPPAGSAPGAPPILVAQKVSSSGQPLAPQWPPPAMQPQSALQQQQQAILQQIVQQQIAQLSPQQQQEILQQQLKALPATQQQQIAQLSPQQQQLAIQQLMLQLPPEQQDQLMQLAIGQLSPQQQNQIKQTTQAVLQQQLQQQQLDLAVPNVAPLVRPKLDDKGAPIVDKNGAPLMEPVLDSAGAPIYQTQYGGMVNAQGVPIEQQIDPNTGNPMFDGTGAPVMQPVVSAAAVPVMVQQVDSKGAPLFTAQGTPVMQVVLDARGSPVYRNQYGAMINAQGVPIQQQLDESGAPMYDSRGAPVMLPQGMVGNPQQGSTMGGQADNPLSGGPDSIQGTVPDHTSHIQGPVIGGGFNTNAKRLLHGKPEGNSVHSEDVEGKGLMLKGKDGKFYYQDGPKAGKRR